jgi:hypothetical protein
MKPEDATRIEALVESAVVALFAAHGLPLGERLTDVDDQAMGHDLAASIGFAGHEIRGALLLMTRMSVIRRTWPAELGNHEPSERELCDWGGEMVNQLLGRIKNALVGFGSHLEQCTPTVVTGLQVHRAPAATNFTRRYCFRVDAGMVVLFFDAATTDRFALGDATSSAVPEGELRLF